jgi:hypothetical protein
MASSSSTIALSAAQSVVPDNAPEASDDGAAVLRARALYAERFVAEHHGRLPAPDRRAAVTPAFELFVTGHETPESVLEMTSGEPEDTPARRFAGMVELACLKTLAQLSHHKRDGAPIKRTIALLACSDPRHMLHTLMLSQRPGLMMDPSLMDLPGSWDAAVDENDDFDAIRAKLPVLQLNFHFNDIVPEAVAKSVLLIYLL